MKKYKIFAMIFALSLAGIAMAGCDQGKSPAVKMSCPELASTLEKKQVMQHVKTLLDNRCPVIYKQGWLEDKARAQAPLVAGCPEAWQGLAKMKMLKKAGEYIKKSCK